MKVLLILILNIQTYSMPYNTGDNNNYRRSHLSPQELKIKNKNAKIAYTFTSFLCVINLILTILDYHFVNNNNILGIIFNGLILFINSLYLILFKFFKIFIKYLFLLLIFILIILNTFLGINDFSIYSIFISVLYGFILIVNPLIINYQYTTATLEELIE